MRLLLDTHIWLWALLQPDRLSARVVDAMTAEDAELWLSPISAWEAHLLAERGRLDLDAPPEEWIRDALEQVPLLDAPLTREVALASRQLRLTHEDPADRFLAATAQVYDLTLVTADRRLVEAPGLSVLPNR